MADEKNKDQNQGSQRDEKAMGATATGGAQSQKFNQENTGQGKTGRDSGQQNVGGNPQESAGQGGGIQGQGQRNPSQGQDKGEDFRPTGGGARPGGGEE